MKKFFNITTYDNYHVVEFLDDEINIHNSSQLLIKLKNDLLDENNKNIIFDLKNIRYADSSFLAKLIFVHKELRKIGKTMVLVSARENLYDIIKLAQLDRILIIKPDIDAALLLIKDK